MNTQRGLVFLGGTVGANHWREEMVIPALVARGIAPDRLFHPEVEHWTHEAQQREDEVKRTADYLLYVIASPDPEKETTNVSVYSLVELLMSLYDAPDRTIALFDLTGMAQHTAKALRKAFKDLQERFPAAPLFTEYPTCLAWLGKRLEEDEKGGTLDE